MWLVVTVCCLRQVRINSAASSSAGDSPRHAAAPYGSFMPPPSSGQRRRARCLQSACVLGGAVCSELGNCSSAGNRATLGLTAILPGILPCTLQRRQ